MSEATRSREWWVRQALEGDHAAYAFFVFKLAKGDRVIAGLAEALGGRVVAALHHQLQSEPSSKEPPEDSRAAAAARERQLVGMLALCSFSQGDVSIAAHGQQAELIAQMTALLASERTVSEVKVALLARFPATVALGEVLQPLLLSESNDDKTRACAALRLSLELRHGLDDEAEPTEECAPRAQMRRLLAEAFAGPLFEQAGVLTKTALSLMALEHMDEPPDQAIEHALAVMADDAAVAAAWAAFPGGDSLWPHNDAGTEEVQITTLVEPEAFRELAQQQLDLQGLAATTTTSSSGAGEAREVEDGRRPTSQAPTVRRRAHPNAFNEIFIAALRERAEWAHQHMLDRMLDRVASPQPSAEHTPAPGLIRCLLALVNTTADDLGELSPVVARHLRRLACEAQFDLVWEFLATLYDGRFGSREGLLGFLDAFPREAVDLTGIEDEDWLNLDPDLGSVLESWIRGLTSPATCYVACRQLREMFFAPGVTTRSRALPAVCKWVVRLLDCPSVPNKLALLEAVLDVLVPPQAVTVTEPLIAGFPTGCLWMDEERFDVVVPELLRAASRPGSFMAEVWKAGVGKEEGLREALRLRTIVCLAAYPSRWQVSMPVLTDVVHDHTQPIGVRATALAALSFIAPLRLDSCAVTQWPEPTRQLGTLLRSLLPFPTYGEVVSLREATLRSLVGRRRHQTGHRVSDGAESANERAVISDSAPSTRGDQGMDRLPEELRLQLVLRSIPRLQRAAAQGFCRLLTRSFDSTGVPDDEWDWAMRWLTSANAVLLEALLDPPPYADGDDAPLEKRHLDFHFLHESPCAITDEPLPPVLLEMLQQHQRLPPERACWFAVLFASASRKIDWPVSEQRLVVQQIIQETRYCGWWMSDRSADLFRDTLAALLGCESETLEWASREGLMAALASAQPNEPRLPPSQLHAVPWWDL